MAEPPAQQSLQLILARNLISTLATPAFLVDADATVVFYNDAAGEFLGVRYEETGRLPIDRWRETIGVVEVDGQADPDELPTAAALRRRRPVHARLRTHGTAGDREIEMLSLPLIGPDDHPEGGVGVFWSYGDEDA